MKIIVVTGTRTELRRRDVQEWLVKLEKPLWILHGDQTGVDRTVRAYAVGAGWQQITLPYPGGLGIAGGPERNGWMLGLAMLLIESYDAKFHALEIHAFPAPDSKGTWNCVKQARESGLTVMVHE